ncbi:MAG: hypothetical protein ACJATN_001340 [Neolewinella sp.]|jgi:hypothetical protein
MLIRLVEADSVNELPKQPLAASYLLLVSVAQDRLSKTFSWRWGAHFASRKRFHCILRLRPVKVRLCRHDADKVA